MQFLSDQLWKNKIWGFRYNAPNYELVYNAQAANSF